MDIIMKVGSPDVLRPLYANNLIDPNAPADAAARPPKARGIPRLDRAV